MATTALVRMPRADEWADRICRQLGKSVEAIIEVGRLLVAAKAKLPHGEFGRMFHEHMVPFGQATGEQLMAIATHPVISNSDHGQILPPSWRTLYQLTRADHSQLRAAIKDGTVTPDMSRKAVVAMLPPTSRHRKARKASQSVPHRSPGTNLYFQIAGLLSDHFDTLSPDDKSYVVSMLQQTLDELRQVTV